jgi:predicted house-cleaning noncanonical NTP pyrophosphatase (MazG superfamily)
VEELADLLEVVYAILDLKGLSVRDFDNLRRQKAEKRGAFKVSST